MSMHISRLFGVEGKNVLVTGGGRGIGRYIAEAFVSNGANVFIASRNREKCESTAEDLSKEGPGRCTPVPMDLGTEDGCQTLASEVGYHVDRLDVLVNNAGVTWGQPFEKYPEKAWDRCFNVNVKAVFSLTRACLPLLDSASAPGDPARVINVGSIAGVIPQPIPAFAYDASKAAVHQLTRKLATELGDRTAHGGHHLSVNAIAPGMVPSDMSEQLLTYADKSAIEKVHPLGRIGSPEDMGGAALFLASRAGAWVTGHILVVDGGVSAAPAKMMP